MSHFTYNVRATRDYDGTVYLFRDIQDGSRLIGVQYGVIQHNATSHVTWHDTKEGSDYNEIKPLFPKEKGHPKAA